MTTKKKDEKKGRKKHEKTDKNEKPMKKDTS